MKVFAILALCIVAASAGVVVHEPCGKIDLLRKLTKIFMQISPNFCRWGRTSRSNQD